MRLGLHIVCVDGRVCMRLGLHTVCFTGGALDLHTVFVFCAFCFAIVCPCVFLADSLVFNLPAWWVEPLHMLLLFIAAKSKDMHSHLA